MSSRTVELRVGGQSYRVVSSASEEELRRLAGVVDGKLAALVPGGRPAGPQFLLLAAIALAHELEVERGRATAIADRARAVLGQLLRRVDDALGGQDGTAAGDGAGGPPDAGGA